MASKGLILMGFAESLASPETAWSLVDGDFEVVAFSRATARPALRKSRLVRLERITPPEVDADAAVTDVRRLIERLRPAALLPADDAAVWLVAQIGENVEIPVVGPTGDHARFALDKRSQIEAARGAGFSVLDTTVVTPEDVDRAQLGFPLHARPALAVERNGPRLGRSAGGSCADSTELTRLLTGAAGSASPFILQPLRSGEGGGIFGLADGSGIRAVSAHRRVRMVSPAGSGSSACAPAEVRRDVIEQTERLIRGLGWRGMFMVEYLVDHGGKPWFVEFNGRPWGSMALARDLGLEYPAWAAAKTVFDDGFTVPDPAATSREFLCRHLGRDIVHLLRVLRGPRETTANWPSRAATLRAVASIRRSDRWYNTRRGEGRVFVSDTLDTLRELRGR